jgi:hypothetical protein
LPKILSKAFSRYTTQSIPGNGMSNALLGYSKTNSWSLMKVLLPEDRKIAIARACRLAKYPLKVRRQKKSVKTAKPE